MADPDNRTRSERFLAEARNALLEGQHKLNVDPEDILKIAGDPVLRHEFVRRFKSEINDPDLQSLIIQYIRSVRDGLEDAAERTENKVELLDRAGLGCRCKRDGWRNRNDCGNRGRGRRHLAPSRWNYRHRSDGIGSNGFEVSIPEDQGIAKKIARFA